MDLANLQDNLPVLVVVLLTWGGVFFYLLRVDRLTRAVERRIGDLTTEDTESTENI
ncbi:MAG TPA: hypothetical protein VNA16_08365 [Abditibacteriaceae bacterium]|nr:hypothetical protein [Abditibacteriaceae bacterium]